MKRQAEAGSVLTKLPYAETRDDPERQKRAFHACLAARALEALANVEADRIAPEKTFPRLNASEVLADVAGGVAYVNGVRAVNRRDDKSPPDLIYTLLAPTSRFLHQRLPTLPRDAMIRRRATYRIRRWQVTK